MDSSPSAPAPRDKARLDGVLELPRLVATPRPLSATLDLLPGRLAAIFEADVCSIYLVEGDQLVLRGNVGFPEEALQDIALGAGEGITGLAVELNRPIALCGASGHDAFRLFPELGEEHYQTFLAVPIHGAAGALGALVLQRRPAADGHDDADDGTAACADGGEGPRDTRRAFVPSDIALATALTTPISAAVERAKLIETLSGTGQRISKGTRRVTLSGRTVVRGKAVGRLWLLPRPSDDLRGPGRDAAATALREAKEQLRRHLELLEQRAASLHADATPLSALGQMLDDTRLDKRVLKLLDERSLCLPRALCTAGAESLRNASRGQDAYAVERARTLSDLCEALALVCAGEPSGQLPRQPVLAGERLTIHDTLLASRVSPAGIVLRRRGRAPLELLLARLLGVPTISGVAGLFRWSDDGALLLVDADHGLLRVNPSRAEVALARDERRRDLPRDPADLAQRLSRD